MPFQFLLHVTVFVKCSSEYSSGSAKRSQCGRTPSFFNQQGAVSSGSTKVSGCVEIYNRTDLPCTFSLRFYVLFNLLSAALFRGNHSGLPASISPCPQYPPTLYSCISSVRFPFPPAWQLHINIQYILYSSSAQAQTISVSPLQPFSPTLQHDLSF